MKILFVSRCPPYPLYLGDRLILGHLGRELARRGHTLDLLAFSNRPEDAAERGQYAADFRHIALFAEPARSPLDYLQRLVYPPARWPHSAAQAWSPALWQALETRLAHEQYDAVHFFGGIQVYEFYHALRGQPAIITPYESYSLYLQREYAGAGGLGVRLRQQIAAHFESWMFTPFRHTVVLAEPDRAELLRLNPRLPVQIIPNGVDTAYFQPRRVARLPALLFLGNYEYAPNVDAARRLAQRIFPAVQQRIPQARLWLVGNAPPPELQALAAPDIRLTGRVPDVRPYLARAGVFVSPLSLGAGMKNKLLEALALGCPVVATPLSVDGIALQDGVHALLAADDAALIDQTVRVLRDAALRERLATQAARLIAEQYSWARVAAAYEQLYRA